MVTKTMRRLDSNVRDGCSVKDVTQFYGIGYDAVSYTHLTLPTILLV